MICSLRSDFRHPSFSSQGSSASFSDNDDAITPIYKGAEVDTDADGSEPECPTSHLSQTSCSAPPLRKSTAETADTAGTADTADTAYLWRQMLALQRRFHCYNSARISAALENELVEAIVPPRACLDLLNDSVTTQLLPDEARREVAALMSGHAGALYKLDTYEAGPVPVAATETATWLPAAVGPSVARSSKARSMARQRRRRMWRHRR
ncbi:hypothetical protein CMQ_4495 [Grosmannia clavigera kw1407]|uniref:Uncharacterized protein n=1 Tax=Grosmannia clavigera (strain kw1407 / UAMH 11150) TaxID=655863 RepID=F0XV30_GROCL|nr:uncharacterized protein CMQ_4495 [Grosmannia clavigera kw1407]EFW98643.1 hypothetical protein CMQ_4495 [Grosmannia clavigera kw1407]